MSSPTSGNSTLRFSEFVVDCRAGELFHRGKKVKLQHQPMQVLLFLLEQAGQVVTREELRQKIWPADTFVDFEHSLNTAVKKLRAALHDSASNAKFVETLPRRGYRFVAKVEASTDKPVATRTPSRLQGNIFTLAPENGTECVLAPVDGKSREEWHRLVGLNDDVGVSMMITTKRLLLLAAGTSVRVLALDPTAGWCEVRVLEGEHYGSTALLARNSLKGFETPRGDKNSAGKSADSTKREETT
ncbi:MAG: winged helix-turn-helix domain-containing protein [Candidatus Acidiferrum sp.]